MAARSGDNHEKIKCSISPSFFISSTIRSYREIKICSPNKYTVIDMVQMSILLLGEVFLLKIEVVLSSKFGKTKKSLHARQPFI